MTEPAEHDLDAIEAVLQHFIDMGVIKELPDGQYMRVAEVPPDYLV